MATPRPNSRIQVLEQLNDNHVVPVVDVNRPELTQLHVRAAAFGVVAGSGAPTNSAAAVAASLVLDSVAVNSDLTVTALVAGAHGNSYSAEIIQPVSLNAPLEVLWDGAKVTINLPTDGAGAPVATSANAVKTAFDLSDAAAVLGIAVEGDGTGTVDGATVANLAGGTDAVAGTAPAYIYVDTNAPALYINTGTLEAPTWTAA